MTKYEPVSGTSFFSGCVWPEVDFFKFERLYLCSIFNLLEHIELDYTLFEFI